MRETAGSVAAPAARCKNLRRGSFIAVLLPDRLYCTRVNGRGRAMRAWIDRTNDGLSGMPADGISLPPKKGGTSARPAGSGSKVRLHQPHDGRKGAWQLFARTRSDGARHWNSDTRPAFRCRSLPFQPFHLVTERRIEIARMLNRRPA